MLKKKELLDFIGFTLAHLKATVATLNAVHFFDLNIVAEDFFAELLNAVYGYSLVNLNHQDLNRAAIDLGDPVRRIAVQVTSQRTKTKIQKTVDTFASHRLADDYDTLKVVIIGDRTGDYPTLTVPAGVTFSGAEDVIDIEWLMKDISRLDVETLTAVADLLRREVSDISASHTESGSRAQLDEIASAQRDMLKHQQQDSQQAAGINQTVGEIRNVVTSLSDTMLPDAMASVHQGILDTARDFLKEHKPTQALELLEKQRSTIWATANGPTKSRLLSAMAGAKLAMGAEDEAAHLFLEAQQYNPHDEKVLSNVAVAYLLLGDHEKAADTAEQAIERNPANVQAYSVLIQSSDEALEEVIERIPELCRTNCEVALAMGFVARRRGDLETARRWLQIAVDHDADNHPDIKGTLGETILHSYTGDPTSPVRIGQVDEASRSDLECVVTLLTEACNAIGDDAALRVRITWLLNVGIASRLLGNNGDAEEYLSRAKRLSPDHPAVVYQCAVVACERHDVKAAIELAQTLEATEEIPHAPLFLAQLLWQDHQNIEAIAELQAFLDSSPADKLATSAKNMLVEFYMETGQLAEALQLSNELVASHPTDVSHLVIASQVYRTMGHTSNADASLEKAHRVVCDSTPSSHLFLLANELGVVGRWAEAAQVFERFVDTSADSPVTRKYLHACYQASLLDKAMEVCRRLREAHGPMEFVTEIEIAILEEAGDLGTARSVCEEFAAAFPEDGKRRVQAAVIYLRQHDSIALDAFLDDPPDWRTLPVECGQQIAQLYSVRQRYREAIELLYEMRRIHSVGKVHLQYLQTFLFDINKHDWLEVHEGGIDVAVCVKDSNGESQWYIIEDRDDADISKGELPASHPLAQALTGKKPGDSVLLKQSNMSTEHGTVTEIKSKYVHAFHESGKVLEVRYPEQSGGFISMKVAPGEAGAKELLQKLGEQQDEQRRVFQQAEALYQTNPLPIGAVARLLHCDIIQAWGHLTDNQESRIVCLSGTAAESRSARELLDRNDVTLVIDAVSLMTIHALSLADEVISTVGRLGISQATIDLLTETFHKRTCISRRGFMTLTKEGETFVRRDVTEEQVAEHLLSLETLIDWVGNSCDVVPWSLALSRKREERKELAEVIGDECLDTVLSACDPSRGLYSDDLRLRQLAEAEFNVEGVATQPILMRSVDAGIIDRSRYNRAIVQLAGAGYLHTSIDGQVLLEAARQADWAVSSPFSNVTWLLQGTYCDEDAAVRVVADFLKQLWQQAMLPRSTDYLVFRLLEELAAGRDAIRVTEKVLAAVSQRFVVIPIAEAELAKLIHAWRGMRIL